MEKSLVGTEIDVGVSDVSGTADMLGELDYVAVTPAYRGGPDLLLQHNDGANLSLLALSEDNLAELATLNPSLSGQVQEIMDAKSLTVADITPEEVIAMQEAVSELNLSAAEVAGNINQQASSIITSALRDPENLDNVVDLDRLHKMMSGEFQFYKNDELYGDAVVAYADMFDTNTIVHGHSPIEWLSDSRAFTPTDTSLGTFLDESYGGLAQHNGINLVNVDSNLSPYTRVDFDTYIEGAEIINGATVLPDDVIINPLVAETVHSEMGIVSSLPNASVDGGYIIQVDPKPIARETLYFSKLYIEESFGYLQN